MKKTLPPYQKHATHQTEICGTHKANGFYYRCIDCNVFVGWLSKQEIQQAEQQGLINNLGPKTWAEHRLYKILQNPGI